MSKWSDAEIALIGAHDSKFPTHEVLHWQQLRAVPQRVRELLRNANGKMAEIEGDRNSYERHIFRLGIDGNSAQQQGNGEQHTGTFGDHVSFSF